MHKSYVKVVVQVTRHFLYQGFAEKYFWGIFLHSKAKTRRENLGSVCILLSDGAMKLTFSHLNPCFILIFTLLPNTSDFAVLSGIR